MGDPAKIAQTALQAITRDLSATSNNLANSQTMGFKQSSVDFYELYVQGSGLGVAVNGTKTDYTTGTIVTTGGATDVAIQDSSFFMVQTPSGGAQQYYTKVGDFELNVDSKLVTPQGWEVQGFRVDEETGQVSQTPEDIKVDSVFLNPEATTSLDLEMTLNVDSAIGDVTEVTSTIIDSLGQEHRLETTYEKVGTNEWTITYGFPDEGVAPQTLPTNLTFDTKGNLVGGGQQSFNFDFSTNGSEPGSIDIDYGTTTQTYSDFTLWTNETDGYATGKLIGTSIDKEGNLLATYSNGVTVNPFKVALAQFSTLGGLTQSQGMLYEESNESGQPIFGTAGSNGFSILANGMLEGSNVDMANELIHMVEVERAFEANSKVLQLTKQLDQKILDL